MKKYILFLLAVAFAFLTFADTSYVVTTKYGCDCCTLGRYSLFASGPGFYVDTWKNYTIFTAPRYSAQELMDSFAACEFESLEKKYCFYQVKPCGNSKTSIITTQVTLKDIQKELPAKIFKEYVIKSKTVPGVYYEFRPGWARDQMPEFIELKTDLYSAPSYTASTLKNSLMEIHWNGLYNNFYFLLREHDPTNALNITVTQVLFKDLK